MADSTVEYYNRNAKRFLEETTQVNFSETQNEFLKLLHEEAVILDFGCGSGRDALTFLKQGFQVDAVDGSDRMCRAAAELTGLPVRHMMFQELDEKENMTGSGHVLPFFICRKRVKNGVGQNGGSAESGGCTLCVFQIRNFRRRTKWTVFYRFYRSVFTAYIGQSDDFKIEKCGLL